MLASLTVSELMPHPVITGVLLLGGGSLAVCSIVAKPFGSRY